MLSYALVQPARAEHDGVAGEHNEDHGDVALPARPPLEAARARAITAGLREAMDDVCRPVAVLASPVPHGPCLVPARDRVSVPRVFEASFKRRSQQQVRDTGSRAHLLVRDCVRV